MTGVVAGAAALGSVALCSLSLHAAYGLLSRSVAGKSIVDLFE